MTSVACSSAPGALCYCPDYSMGVGVCLVLTSAPGIPIPAPDLNWFLFLIQGDRELGSKSLNNPALKESEAAYGADKGQFRALRGGSCPLPPAQ